MKFSYHTVFYLHICCMTVVYVTSSKSNLNTRSEDTFRESALYDDGILDVKSSTQSCNLILFNPDRYLDVIFDENFDDASLEGWINPSNVKIVKEKNDPHTRVKRQRRPPRKTTPTTFKPQAEIETQSSTIRTTILDSTLRQRSDHTSNMTLGTTAETTTSIQTSLDLDTIAGNAQSESTLGQEDSLVITSDHPMPVKTDDFLIEMTTRMSIQPLSNATPETISLQESNTFDFTMNQTTPKESSSSVSTSSISSLYVDEDISSNLTTSNGDDTSSMAVTTVDDEITVNTNSIGEQYQNMLSARYDANNSLIGSIDKDISLEGNFLYNLDFTIKVVGYNLTLPLTTELKSMQNSELHEIDVPYFCIRMINPNETIRLFNIQEYLNYFKSESDWVELRHTMNYDGELKTGANWTIKVELLTHSNGVNEKSVYLKNMKLTRTAIIASNDFVRAKDTGNQLKNENKSFNKSARQTYTTVVGVLVVLWIVTAIALTLMYVKLKTKNDDLQEAIETYRKFIPKGGNEVLW